MSNYTQTCVYNQKIYSRLLQLNLVSLFNFPILISGSFIVQTILNETYDYYDVDIYFIVKNELEKANIIFHIENVLSGIKLNIPSSITTKLNFSAKYVTPNCVINLIGLNKNVKDIYQHILSISDIDICTSSFDGYSLRYPSGLLNREANLININCRINSKWVNKFIKLIDKNRGHPLTNPYFLSFGFNVYESKILRLEKYLQRGFSIRNKNELVNYDYYRNIIYQMYEKLKASQKLYYDALMYSTAQMIYGNMPSPILPTPREEIILAWRKKYLEDKK
jgi:hypothetical protein